jgi:coiled-coil domain-containing protein 130
MRREPSKQADDFKDPQGIMGSKFEIPFHVRCLSCKTLIAKGVRFSALKKKTGKFLSTDIFQFAFKCKLCKSQIVVETDPKNSEYKFIEGAYKIVI